MSRLIIIISCLLTSFISNAKPKPLPIETFSKASEFGSVKISPTGKYLAVMTQPNGKNSLMILDTDTFKVLHAINFPKNAQVGNYYWVNEERIVLAKEYLKGWKDHPEYHGELFGVNADGSQGEYLVGYQGERQTGTRIKKATPVLGTSYVLDPLVENKRKMLVLTIPWTAAKEPHTIVYEVDVYRGTRKKNHTFTFKNG
ncbi:hypothetical protein [Pseudoalteromonas sp. GB43]